MITPPTLRNAAVLAQVEESPVPVLPDSRPQALLPRDSPIGERLFSATVQSTSNALMWIPDASLEDAARYLSDTNEINVVINEAAIGPEFASVTAMLDGPGLAEALNLMLDPVDLGWAINGNALVLTSRREASASTFEVHYLLNGLMKAGVSPGRLAEIIPIAVAGDSWKSPGGTGSLRVGHGALIVQQSAAVHRQIHNLVQEMWTRLTGETDEKTSTIVYAIDMFLNAGLAADEIAALLTEFVARHTWERVGGNGTIRVHNDTLVIRQKSWVHERVGNALSHLENLVERGALQKADAKRRIGGTDRATGHTDRALRRTLRMPVHVEHEQLEGTTMASVLELLAWRHQFTPVPDREALAEAGVDLLNIPFDRDLHAQSLADAVDQLLHPLALDWTLTNQAILITTPRRAASIYSTTVYQIRDLIDSGHDPEKLIARLQNEVGPRTWHSSGGRGSIHTVGELLIVTQTIRGHLAIERRLDELRSQVR